MRTLKTPIRSASTGLARRQVNNTVGVTVDNQVSISFFLSLETFSDPPQNLLYTVEVSMGTPPQKMILQLDTGSADLWVPSTAWCESNTSQQNGGDPCKGIGSYSANDSSSFQYVNSDFLISYVDGSETAGDFGTDTFSVAGVSVPDMQFGIGYNITGNSFTGGILGISYAADEAGDVSGSSAASYPNFPAKLVADNLINSRAYSLYLDSQNARSGIVLFGGIDTSRFQGTLQTRPIIPAGGVYRDLQIALDAVSVAGAASLGPSDPVPALLDSGTSFTYIPDDIAFSLFDTFSANYDQAGGNAYVDCSLRSQDSPVVFSFGPASISLSMGEMVLDANVYAAGGSETGQSNACAFGILPMSAMNLSSPILGDTFLRSAYVVYDLDNNEISLAQAAYDVKESNIMEIGEGPNAVPDATGTGTGGTQDDGNAAAGLVPATQVALVGTALYAACMALGVL